MHEGIWVENNEGQPEFISYEDIEPGVLAKLIQPVGGFCYSVSDFKHLPLVQAPFIIENWLPYEGKMVFFGFAKSGKSFLCLQLADCIGSGKPFLGMATTPARVLYLQFELSPKVLQNRLVSTKQPYHNVFVGTHFGMKLDTTFGQGILEAAVCMVKPEVVILDPFYKVHSGDENDSSDVKKVLDFCDDMIQAYRCAFVIVHHMGKDAGRGARGSTTFGDYPDSYVVVKRKDDILTVKPEMLRHSQAPDEPITAVFNQSTLQFETASTSAPSMAKLEAYVKKQGLVNFEEILGSDEFGKRRTVYDNLAKMIKEGKVERIEKGVYKWKE